MGRADSVLFFLTLFISVAALIIAVCFGKECGSRGKAGCRGFTGFTGLKGERGADGPVFDQDLSVFFNSSSLNKSKNDLKKDNTKETDVKKEESNKKDEITKNQVEAFTQKNLSLNESSIDCLSWESSADSDLWVCETDGRYSCSYSVHLYSIQDLSTSAKITVEKNLMVQEIKQKQDEITTFVELDGKQIPITTCNSISDLVHSRFSLIQLKKASRLRLVLKNDSPNIINVLFASLSLNRIA